MSAREKTTDNFEPDFSLSALTAAAHELKAPLALIRQLSLVLQQNDASADAKHDQEELLRRITLTSERALRLISLLTKHARLEDALFQLEPVNARHICEQVSYELWPLAHAKQRPIILKVSSKHQPIAVAHPELLKAIVLGLCDNSFAYAQSNEPLQMVIGERQGTVRIAIRDRGPALSANAFKELRQRLGKTLLPLSGRPQSSGLGLYVAGRFAEVMQGTLGVQRHRDAGATFYVDMPQSRQLSFFANE